MIEQLGVLVVRLILRRNDLQDVLDRSVDLRSLKGLVLKCIDT